MLALTATTKEKPNKQLRQEGSVPAVIYGHNLKKNDVIAVNEKEFRKVFRQAGESSLIEISIDEGKEKRTVLVNDVQKDPVSGDPIHIDFFQPNLKEEVEVAIPIVFIGTAPAEKDLGGTLSKNIQEVEVRALPQNLPHDITVDISGLNTFEDHILIKDLKVAENVQILKEPDEIVASVLPPQNVEEELAATIEENVENVEQVVKEKKEEEEVVEGPAEAPK